MDDPTFEFGRDETSTQAVESSQPLLNEYRGSLPGGKMAGAAAAVFPLPHTRSWLVQGQLSRFDTPISTFFLSSLGARDYSVPLNKYLD